MRQMDYNIQDTLEQIKEFLPRLLEECDTVAANLYEAMNDETWKQFGDVVEGLDDLYRTLNIINADISDKSILSAIKPCITRSLTGISSKFQLMNACIDAEDFIGTSDYIMYELMPLIQQLAVELGEEKYLMDQRFMKNLNYLEREYPNVYAVVSSLTTNESDYQIVYARNGMPNICKSEDGNKKKFLYSQFDPNYEAENWANRLADKVEGKTSILMYGFGFGYHALSYSKKYTEHNLSIYEPDEQVLLAAMSVIDLKNLFEQFKIIDFVVGNKKEQRDDMLYTFVKYMKGDPEIISVPIYDKIQTALKKTFMNDATLSILNYMSSIENYERNAMEWVTNSMYNLLVTLNTPSISGLKDKLNGLTAVIVGGGPSLAADIDCLRKIKNHAFIIAAGSAIQSLLYHGIEPHLIVSFDGGEANYDVFKNIDTKGIPFLYAPMINHQIMNNRTEHVFHAHLGSDWTSKRLMELAEGDPTFRSTHSVTGMAIQAAIFMGCKQIIFTGQDLSYPEEEMYAAGAKHVSKEAMSRVINQAIYSVENVNGTMNRTTIPMMLTLSDIENLIEENPMAHFINCTRMGAKIKHTISQPMDSVLVLLKEQYLEEDFLKSELACLQHYDERRIREIRDRISKLPADLLVLQQQLQRISEGIGSLSELSKTDLNKCSNTIIEIDADWELVVSSISFNSLYVKACINELNVFERDLLELSDGLEIVKQAAFYRDSMNPLIQKMLERTPKLIEVVYETNRRVNKSI